MEGMPIVFRKKLTATDVGQRLTWNTKQLPLVRRVCATNLNQESHVLPTGEERFLNFKVRDIHNIIWEFGLITRRIDLEKQSNHPNPVIRRGWTSFVREYQLCVGDEIIFYKNVDPNLQQVPFTIIVKRLAPILVH